MTCILHVYPQSSCIPVIRLQFPNTLCSYVALPGTYKKHPQYISLHLLLLQSCLHVMLLLKPKIQEFRECENDSCQIASMWNLFPYLVASVWTTMALVSKLMSQCWGQDQVWGSPLSEAVNWKGTRIQWGRARWNTEGKSMESNLWENKSLCYSCSCCLSMAHTGNTRLPIHGVDDFTFPLPGEYGYAVDTIIGPLKYLCACVHFWGLGCERVCKSKPVHCPHFSLNKKPLEFHHVIDTLTS